MQTDKKNPTYINSVASFNSVAEVLLAEHAPTWRGKRIVPEVSTAVWFRTKYGEVVSMGLRIDEGAEVIWDFSARMERAFRSALSIPNDWVLCFSTYTHHQKTGVFVVVMWESPEYLASTDARLEEQEAAKEAFWKARDEVVEKLPKTPDRADP